MALHDEHNEGGGKNTAIKLDEQEKVVFCKLCEATKAKATHLTGAYFDIIDLKNEEAGGVVYSLEKHKKLVEHRSPDYFLRLTPEGYENCKKICGKKAWPFVATLRYQRQKVR